MLSGGQGIVCSFSLEHSLAIYFTFPYQAKTFTKFCFMLSQDSFEKHPVWNQLKRLAKEDALWHAHRATLACVAFLGENYPFTGQLKSIWLLCQLKNSANSVPATITCGCLKFPLNEMEISWALPSINVLQSNGQISRDQIPVSISIRVTPGQEEQGRAEL